VFLKVCTFAASLSPVRLYSSIRFKKSQQGKGYVLDFNIPKNRLPIHSLRCAFPTVSAACVGAHEPSMVWVGYPNLQQDFQLFRAFFSRVDSRCVNNEKQSGKEPMLVDDCPVM